MKAALRILTLLCCPALLASAASLPQSDSQRTPAQITPAEIKKLIEDLGSTSFKIRENANKRLADMGKPAFNALKEAEKSTDAETRQRARLLVTSILAFERLPTVVNGVKFELVVEPQETGLRTIKLQYGASVDISLVITNVGKSTLLLKHGEAVRPSLTNGQGENRALGIFISKSRATAGPRALNVGESHTILVHVYAEASKLELLVGEHHWVSYGFSLTKGTYRFSLTYENQYEVPIDGIPLWVGTVTTPEVTLLIE